MNDADAQPLRLQLVATFADGALVLRTAAGQHYTALPLDELDAVDALLQLQQHRGGDLRPLASLDRLDAALCRNGWERTAAWSAHPKGITAPVEAL